LFVSSTSRAYAEYQGMAEVDRIAGRFAEGGAGVESVLVFTHDCFRTIDKVASDYDVDAILTPGHVIDSPERGLVPSRGEGNLERIVGNVIEHVIEDPLDSLLIVRNK
jgi:hypothetical protein